MFCARCGKQMDDNSTFCPFCGQKVGEPVERKRKADFSIPFPVSAKKPVFAAAVCIVLLVIVGKVFHPGSSDYERAMRAYLKYADSMDCEASYYLVDMDGDSVPECLVWDYAGNGELNHSRVLGYKKNDLVEVSRILGGGTVSSSNYIKDGTIFWYPDSRYFVMYANWQTWWGDLLKEDKCFEDIYKISSSGFEEYHFIMKNKYNNDAYWSYAVDGEGSLDGSSERMASSIYSELADCYYESKEPTRYVSMEEAIETYERGI